MAAAPKRTPTAAPPQAIATPPNSETRRSIQATPSTTPSQQTGNGNHRSWKHEEELKKTQHQTLAATTNTRPTRSRRQPERNPQKCLFLIAIVFYTLCSLHQALHPSKSSPTTTFLYTPRFYTCASHRRPQHRHPKQQRPQHRNPNQPPPKTQSPTHNGTGARNRWQSQESPINNRPPPISNCNNKTQPPPTHTANTHAAKTTYTLQRYITTPTPSTAYCPPIQPTWLYTHTTTIQRNTTQHQLTHLQGLTYKDCYTHQSHNDTPFTTHNHQPPPPPLHTWSQNNPQCGQSQIPRIQPTHIQRLPHKNTPYTQTHPDTLTANRHLKIPPPLHSYQHAPAPSQTSAPPEHQLRKTGPTLPKIRLNHTSKKPPQTTSALSTDTHTQTLPLNTVTPLPSQIPQPTLTNIPAQRGLQREPYQGLTSTSPSMRSFPPSQKKPPAERFSTSPLCTRRCTHKSHPAHTHQTHQQLDPYTNPLESHTHSRNNQSQRKHRHKRQN